MEQVAIESYRLHMAFITHQVICTSTWFHHPLHRTIW